MATDLNSGMLGKTFKTATLGGGFGALKNNADTLRGFVMQDPALLEKIGGEKALNDYIKQHQQAVMWNPETNGEFKFSDEARKIDELLAGYQMNSVGHAGKDDGRAKAIVKDGQTLYAGDAYSYKPAKDNLDTLLKGAALIGGTYAAFSPGGLLSGLSAGNGATGAAAGEAGALSGLDAAALDAGAGLSGGAGGSVVGGSAGTGALGGLDAVAAAESAAGGLSAATGGAAAGAESALGALAGDSATKAALFGNAGYGAGMSGTATSVFDTVLAATGSTSLAATAGSVANGGSWLSSTWSALTGGGATGGSLLGGLLGGSSLLRDLLPLVGAGVQQYNLEKMASDQRAWQDKKESDARRRRMPTTGTGMLGKFRVIPGAGNGG